MGTERSKNDLSVPNLFLTVQILISPSPAITSHFSLAIPTFGRQASRVGPVM